MPSRCRPPRAPANLVVAALAFSCFAFDTGAQSRAGSRDLAGVWNYATMTPLEREFAGRETLTEAEALAYERQTVQRQATANNTAGPDWWDPGTRHLTNPPDLAQWTSPGTVRFPMHRTNQRIYEYACHEGNFRSVEGILRGARAQERDSR